MVVDGEIQHTYISSLLPQRTSYSLTDVRSTVKVTPFDMHNVPVHNLKTQNGRWEESVQPM
jgi:hypothetical protein